MPTNWTWQRLWTNDFLNWILVLHLMESAWQRLSAIKVQKSTVSLTHFMSFGLSQLARIANVLKRVLAPTILFGNQISNLM